MSDPVATVDEIPEGGSIRREVDGRAVAIFRKGDDIYVIDATCPHRGGPLDGCETEGDFLAVCPWHGWDFDIRTGKSANYPARVCSHRATVVDGRISVELCI